jgi:hypothetical protein
MKCIKRVGERIEEVEAHDLTWETINSRRIVKLLAHDKQVIASLATDRHQPETVQVTDTGFSFIGHEVQLSSDGTTMEFDDELQNWDIIF